MPKVVSGATVDGKRRGGYREQSGICMEDMGGNHGKSILP